MNLLISKKWGRIVPLIACMLWMGCQKNIPENPDQVSEEKMDTPEYNNGQTDGHSDKEDQQTDSNRTRMVFAGGVSTAHGWHDVEKLPKPEDYMACWLITASNMIDWWQSRYVEGGKRLPADVPFGKGTGPYQSAVFDKAILCFNGMNLGGDINAGLDWYINGVSDGISNHSQPKQGTGGYLKSVDPNLIRFSRKPFSNFSDWESATSHENALKTFSNRLLEHLKKGCVIGLDIKTHLGFGGNLHAITLWGTEVNENGEVNKIYITDSDDLERQLVECKIHAATDEFQSKVIALEIPPGQAYPAGAEWEILRLYYLQDPNSN